MGYLPHSCHTTTHSKGRRVGYTVTAVWGTYPTLVTQLHTARVEGGVHSDCCMGYLPHSCHTTTHSKGRGWGTQWLLYGVLTPLLSHNYTQQGLRVGYTVTVVWGTYPTLVTQLHTARVEGGVHSDCFMGYLPHSCHTTTHSKGRGWGTQWLLYGVLTPLLSHNYTQQG